MVSKPLIEKMRSVLLRRRDALRRSLRGELGRFNTSEERPVGDHADAALDTDYGAINSLLAEAESRELMQIEFALELIRKGRYGVCGECGKKIPAARIQALPFATHCVKCQQLAEERNAGFPESEPTWPTTLLNSSDSVL